MENLHCFAFSILGCRLARPNWHMFTLKSGCSVKTGSKSASAPLPAHFAVHNVETGASELLWESVDGLIVG